MISNKSISSNKSINIDVFRALLAQWVIIGHLGPELFSWPIVPGRAAVWGFFIISGYLNAKSFLNKKESHGWFSSITGYYLSRIKRIYPLLLINCAVVSFFAGSLFVNDWYVLFPYMHSAPYQFANGVLWTLVIEIQLYFITPMLFLVVLKLKTVDWKIHTLICIALIFMIPLMRVYLSGNHDLIDDRTISGNIGFYLFGMLMSLGITTPAKLSKKQYSATLILLIIFAAYFIIEYNFKSQGIQFKLGPFLALLASFLVLTAPGFLVKIGHPIFTFLGYYTYEIYVLHGLLVFVFHQMAMQGLISTLLMWWLMPILLVITFDMIYMKKYKLILN